MQLELKKNNIKNQLIEIFKEAGVQIKFDRTKI